MNEKNILLSVHHPFIIKFYSSFQDHKYLFFVMEYAKGGPINKYLVRSKPFSEDIVRFYSAEIILALQALHQTYNVMYRDLKPENILLTETGHIKLTDFGLSTIGKQQSTHGCGTPEFIAPEILKLEPHTKLVDYWSLGCIIYLFLYGKSPFYDPKVKVMYEKIKKGKYVFPEKPHVSKDAKDLIKGLLKLRPTDRLGAKGIEEIKKMEFYNDV